MRTVRGMIVLIGSLLLLLCGPVSAGGDWSAAKGKVEELKTRQQELRKLSPSEIRKVVTAVCEADEEDRLSVGKDAADRVASLVSNELSNLRNIRDAALRLLDDVLADDSLKDKHSDAKQLKEDVQSRWSSIERMAKNSMRGGNHPIVAFMSAKGMEEHKRYQESSSNCHAYEFTTGSRRADCLYAAGETCLVIELKPDNSRAISRGQRQAQDSVDFLNNELQKKDSDVIKDLVSKRSDFAKCKRFERRIKCYKLCPEVDEEGEYRESSATWRDCS